MRKKIVSARRVWPRPVGLTDVAVASRAMVWGRVAIKVEGIFRNRGENRLVKFRGVLFLLHCIGFYGANSPHVSRIVPAYSLQPSYLALPLMMNVVLSPRLANSICRIATEQIL